MIEIMAAVSTVLDWIGALTFSLLAAIAAQSTMAFGVSSRSEHNIAWYASLPKSAVTPPAIIFSIVWPVLYGLITASIWLYWREGSNDDGDTLYNVTLAFYVAQLVLNALWSILFFVCHAILLTFIDIALLIGASIIVLSLYAVQSRWLPFGLFLPYILWILFAAYLNWYILVSILSPSSAADRSNQRRR